MNLEWNDTRTRKFATHIGLITSNGSFGENIMAVEWTHQVSYAPCLLTISIYPSDATHANILETNEFGVNLSAVDQNVITSIAGNYSGIEVHKIAVLKELGVEFYPGKQINVPMIKGASLNAECKLFQTIELGDHTMFVGEVVEISSNDKPPLVFHNGQFWQFGETIQKPPEDMMGKIREMTEKHVRKKDYA